MFRTVGLDLSHRRPMLPVAVVTFIFGWAIVAGPWTERLES